MRGVIEILTTNRVVKTSEYLRSLFFRPEFFLQARKERSFDFFHLLENLRFFHLLQLFTNFLELFHKIHILDSQEHKKSAHYLFWLESYSLAKLGVLNGHGFDLSL